MSSFKSLHSAATSSHHFQPHICHHRKDIVSMCLLEAHIITPGSKNYLVWGKWKEPCSMATPFPENKCFTWLLHVHMEWKPLNLKLLCLNLICFTQIQSCSSYLFIMPTQQFSECCSGASQILREAHVFSTCHIKEIWQRGWAYTFGGDAAELPVAKMQSSYLQMICGWYCICDTFL